MQKREQATPKRKRRKSAASLSAAEADEELKDAREELARARARDPFKRTVATFDHEDVLPGSTFGITLVYTLFLKMRTGASLQMEISQLLGQASHTFTGDPSTLKQFVDRAEDSLLKLDVKPRMRYPLKDQPRDDVRTMVDGVFRGYKRAEVRMRVRGLSSLFNLATWLEAPHFETLKKTEGAAGHNKGRNQVWWCTLCQGVLELRTRENDARPRVSVAAHRAIVHYRKLPRSHGFTVTLPDGRVWSMTPQSKNEAVNWIWALEYRRPSGDLALLWPSRRRTQSNAAKMSRNCALAAEIGSASQVLAPPVRARPRRGAQNARDAAAASQEDATPEPVVARQPLRRVAAVVGGRRPDVVRQRVFGVVRRGAPRGRRAVAPELRGERRE